MIQIVEVSPALITIALSRVYSRLIARLIKLALRAPVSTFDLGKVRFIIPSRRATQNARLAAEEACL